MDNDGEGIGNKAGYDTDIKHVASDSWMVCVRIHSSYAITDSDTYVSSIRRETRTTHHGTTGPFTCLT